MIRTVALLSCLAAPAQAVDFEFCWVGADGYRMAGTMTVPDVALSKPLVTEADVTAFAIKGSRGGVPVGNWTLSQLTPTTSWHLNFDPQRMIFPTGGSTHTERGQQWNASGTVNDCGTPGFGFNSGNAGQDVCVDGTYIISSNIATDSYFAVYLAGAGPSCTSAPLLGLLDQRGTAAS